MKFSPALKSFSGSRFEGVIETAHLIFHNPFNFLELYKFLKKKVEKCRRIYNTVKCNWAVHVVETIENSTELLWLFAYTMISKCVFGPVFSSGFTMDTCL